MNVITLTPAVHFSSHPDPRRGKQHGPPKPRDNGTPITPLPKGEDLLKLLKGRGAHATVTDSDGGTTETDSGGTQAVAVDQDTPLPQPPLPDLPPEEPPGKIEGDGQPPQTVMVDPPPPLMSRGLPRPEHIGWWAKLFGLLTVGGIGGVIAEDQLHLAPAVMDGFHDARTWTVNNTLWATHNISVAFDKAADAIGNMFTSLDDSEKRMTEEQQRLRYQNYTSDLREARQAAKGLNPYGRSRTEQDAVEADFVNKVGQVALRYLTVSTDSATPIADAEAFKQWFVSETLKHPNKTQQIRTLEEAVFAARKHDHSQLETLFTQNIERAQQQGMLTTVQREQVQTGFANAKKVNDEGAMFVYTLFAILAGYLVILGASKTVQNIHVSGLSRVKNGVLGAWHGVIHNQPVLKTPAIQATASEALVPVPLSETHPEKL